MDIATAGSQILAQIELANQSSQEGEEALLYAAQGQDSEEMPGSPPRNLGSKGFLFTESGYYNLRSKGESDSQKFSNSLFNNNSFKESKFLENKEKSPLLQFKESLVREKSTKASLQEKSELSARTTPHFKNETSEKTKQIANSFFPSNESKKKAESKSFSSPLAQPKNSKQTASSQRHQETTKNAFKKQNASEAKAKDSLHSEKRSEENLRSSVNRQDDPVREKQQKQKEQEQGFAEDQKKQQKEEHDQEDGETSVVKALNFENEFKGYASQESKLSEYFTIRVSQFDILHLFMELLKLALKNREQERISRRLERELQLDHMQKVVDNFKQQAKFQLFAGIGSGVLAIFSGLCPIVGHLKGDLIRDKMALVPFLSKMASLKTDKLFKSLKEVTSAMSQMQQNTGQIQTTFAESSRTYDQHMSELHKSDGDENTRVMEEIKDHWKNIENFLYQSMQMYHDASRQLYS